VSQFTDVPQLLVTVPHLPLHVVVSGCGWHVHELWVVVLHTYPVPIAAQLRWPVTLSQLTGVPQLLFTVPHLPLHVVVSATGVHPHWLGVPPPPHVCGAVHVTPPFDALHVTLTLQLLTTLPHLPPHVVPTGCGVHPHALATPEPPHVCGAAHTTPPFDALHVTIWPQLLVTVPHLPLHAALLSGTHALHAPAAQPYGQAIASCHVPVASQVCSSLALHRVACGWQLPPQVLPTHR